MTLLSTKGAPPYDTMTAPFVDDDGDVCYYKYDHDEDCWDEDICYVCPKEEYK